MVKHTLYARPTIISQENTWRSDKKYSSWAHVRYMGSTYQNCVKVDNKFEGAWISTTGVGNLSESYKTKEMKYSKIYLNSRQWNKKKAPKIEAKTFFLQVPRNATISKMGIIVRCYSDRNMNMDSPSISCNNIKLPSKNLATEYAKVKPHYITPDNGNNSNLSRLYISNKIPYTPMNLTFEWSGKDLKYITREVLNDPYFGFKIDFKENKSNTGGFVYVDAIALYVEYETPEYYLENGYDKTEAVVGEKFKHQFHLKNTNGLKIDKNCTKIKIPACFDVVEDECSATKGTFERYTGTDYEYIYNTRIVPLNGEGSTYNKPKKGKNPVVVRGTHLIVELQDGYGHPIPYKQVTIKILDQLYTHVTDYNGHAWHCINLYKDGIYDVECSFVDNFYEDCYSRFKMQVVTDRSVSFEIEDRTDSNNKFYQGSYYSVRLGVGDNNEILTNGKVEFTFVNQKNSKDKHVFTHNVDGNGMAYHLMDFGGGNTYDVTLKFTPKNVTTDSDGFYKTYFDSATYKTTLKIEPEAKQDAELMIPASRTGYNKYNYDTKQYDHVDDGIYHVGRFHHILFYARDSNGNHILDHEQVDIEVTQQLVDGVWVNLNGEYDVYHTTSYSGIVPYDFTLPVGTYRLQATLLPNRASHWNKAVKSIVVEVHEPPLDDTYNYMWIVDYPDDEVLTLTLIPNRLGKCNIDSWNTITGLSPTCTYDIKEFAGDDGIYVLTKQVHRNTDETIDILFQFNPNDYAPDFTDQFNFFSKCSYTKNGKTREIFTDDVDWETVDWADVDGANLNKGYVSGQTFNDHHALIIMPNDPNGKYMAYIKLPIHTYAPAGSTCQFCIQVENNFYKHCYDIEVLEQLPYKFDLSYIDELYTRSSEQLNKATVDGYRLDCGGDYTTKFNYKQLFTTNVESPFIFIGPVRLHRSHMKPSGSTTQTLLSKQYNNRVILKKKGDYEDKVDTTIRVKPAQLATIKGLCKLDMPTPIHLANVPSWNPLTVHGWVELYGTSSEKEINSKLYETKLEWRYLTKELYSLMTIVRDKNPVHTYNSTSRFSVNHYFDEPVLDWFSYEGYGTVVDDDDSEYDEIVVNPGNTDTLISTKKLQPRSRITLKWKDYLRNKSNDELSSNVRIIRILKENKDTGAKEPVFTYTYSDFTHFLYDNSYPVDTIVNEVGVRANIVEDDVNRNLSTGRVVLDFDEDYVTGNSNETIYTDGAGNPNYLVGSEIVITVEGNRLSLLDKGHSGNEFSVNNVELDIGDYYLQVEYDNQSNNINFDYDYTLWDSLLGVQVETDNTTKEFDAVYAEHIVSPGAIYNAPLSFTRQGEDGLIYYYEYKNGQSYKYRGDPYNPYKNGTDLCTIDGVSLFDCNNDLSPLCLSNGLVRVAIHRYAGYVEFYHYDVLKNDYVFCGSMWTDMDNRHMSVERITDDKIVLNWGTTVWTIWRGRPFIEVKHDKVDFRLHTGVQRVYADTGNGVGLYDCDYNLNLFDYLGKNSTMDTKYIGVGIKGNPSNGTSFSDLTLQCYYEDSTGVKSEVVDGSRNKSVNDDILTMDYRVGKVLSIDGVINRTNTDSSSVNVVDEEFTYHIMRYDEASDKWVYYDYFNITSDGRKLKYRANSMGVMDNVSETVRMKIMFDGDDYYHASESEEFILNIIGRKREPDMKIDLVNKDSSRYHSETDSYDYLLGDTVTATVTVLDDENEPLKGKTVTLYWDTIDGGLATYTLNSKSDSDYDKDKYVFSKDIVLSDSKIMGGHYLHAMIGSDDTFASDDSSVHCLVRDKPVINLAFDVYHAPASNGGNPSYTDISTASLNSTVRVRFRLKDSQGSDIAQEPLYYKIYENNMLLEEGTVLTPIKNSDGESVYELLTGNFTGDDVDKQMIVYYNGTSVYDAISKTVGLSVGKTVTTCKLNDEGKSYTLGNGGKVKVTYTGKVTDNNGAGLTNGTVTLMVDGYSTSSVANITDGTFSLTYTYGSAGTSNVYVKYNGTGSLSNVNSNTVITSIVPNSISKDTSIILSGDNLTCDVGDVVYFKVHLTDSEGVNLSDKTVSLYVKTINGSGITVSKYSDMVTGVDGSADVTYSPTTEGSFMFYAVFDGVTGKYNGCKTSSDIVVNVGVGSGTIPTVSTISVNNSSVGVGDNVVFTVTVKDNNGNSVSGSVDLYIDGSLYDTVNVVDGSGTYTYKTISAGSLSVYAVFNSTGDYITSHTDKVNITVSKSAPNVYVNVSPTDMVLVGDTLTVTGAVRDKNNHGVSNVKVDLYVNGTSVPGYSSISDSDGNVTFNYVTTGSGSTTFSLNTGETEEYGVGSSNVVTVTVNTEIVLYNPSLTGSEAKKTISGSTTISGGVMTGGCSYLTDGFNNKVNWKLTCDIKINTNCCGVYLIFPGTTERNKDLLNFWYESDTSNGLGIRDSNKTSISGISINKAFTLNKWYSLTIIKKDTQFSIILNGVTYNMTWTQQSTQDKLCIGVDYWRSGSSSIRNIKVIRA